MIGFKYLQSNAQDTEKKQMKISSCLPFSWLFDSNRRDISSLTTLMNSFRISNINLKDQICEKLKTKQPAGIYASY